MGDTIKVRILSVEALHNGEGWAYNNWHTLKETEIQDSISDRDLIKYLITEGHLTSMAVLDKTVVMVDDGYNIEVQEINNEYCPILALCYGEYL